MNLAIVKIINALSCVPNFSHVSPISLSGNTIVFPNFTIDVWTDSKDKLYSIRLHKTNIFSNEFWIGVASNFNGTQMKNHPYTTLNCKVFNGHIVAINGQPVNGELHRHAHYLSGDRAAAFNALCLVLNIKDH